MSDLLAGMWLGMRARSPVKTAWDAVLALRGTAIAAAPDRKKLIETHFAKLQQYYFANSRQTLVKMRSMITAEMRSVLQNPSKHSLQQIIATNGDAAHALSELLGGSIFESFDGVSDDNWKVLRAQAAALVAALDKV